MIIEIKNLIKPYNKDFNILNNITKTIDLTNGPVVVLGEEGSGKTTLFNILAGLDDSYEGDIIIDGVNRREFDNKLNSISYIMDKPVLFEGKSVLKNLLYVYKVKDRKYNKDEAMASIKEISKELGITSVLGKRVKKCNIFEKKLVCLARFYLKKPALLIMDEPLNGLVELEKSCLLNHMFSLARKLSSGVFVSEKGENARYFEHCFKINLDFGSIK